MPGRKPGKKGEEKRSKEVERGRKRSKEVERGRGKTVNEVERSMR
jgi:hypothetical protein